MCSKRKFAHLITESKLSVTHAVEHVFWPFCLFCDQNFSGWPHFLGGSGASWRHAKWSCLLSVGNALSTAYLLVFRKKDLYLIIKQKLTFMKSGGFHEIRWISGEIHPKPYKIRCFNKNSLVWGGAWRDFMKSGVIAPLLHSSNWIVLVETFAFIRFWVDFMRISWNLADFMWNRKTHLQGIVTLCFLSWVVNLVALSLSTWTLWMPLKIRLFFILREIYFQCW